MKLQDGVLKAPAEHLEKLKRDYFSLHQKELQISLDDLIHFINNHGHPAGTWRFNVYASSPIRYQLTLENKPPLKTYCLKRSHSPFYEPFAQVKKEDFSLRKKQLLKASKEGFDDWIFTDNEGHFLETAVCNLFWIRGKTLFTPSSKLSLYFGVTIQAVIRAAERLGYEILEVKEKKIEALLRSFLFVTNSMKEILPVHQVDNQTLATNLEIFEELKKEFESALALEDVL